MCTLCITGILFTEYLLLVFQQCVTGPYDNRTTSIVCKAHQCFHSIQLTHTLFPTVSATNLDCIHLVNFTSCIKFCNKMLIYFSCVHGHILAKQLYENTKADSLQVDSLDKVNFSFLLNSIYCSVTWSVED
jgi:hypothetical protein